MARVCNALPPAPIAAGGFGNGTPANGLPKAFVNIILFDANYKLLDFSYAQVTSSGAPTLIQSEYIVKEAGYAYVFISNEHPTQADVYFDDVKMSYTPSRVIQYNEYYPFGLQTATSWSRENTTGNNFLGNGGTELNTTSALYDLDYRNFDPILGRMHGVDPMATKYASLSPYNFSFNDPVTFNDPSGADPWDEGPYGGSMAYYYAIQLSYGGMSPGQETIMDPGGYGYGGGMLYWNPATAGGYGVAGMGMNPNFSVIGFIASSWAPDIRGPVYLGTDLYNNSITALPSEIARAGGVNAFLRDYHKSNYSVTIDFDKLPDHSQTTLFFESGAVVGIIQRAINVNNIEALKKIAESIGIGDLDDVIASHDKVLDFVFKTLTDLGNFSLTKQDLESMEFDLSTHEILDGITKISKMGNEIFIERANDYYSVFEFDLDNHVFEFDLRLKNFISVKYELGRNYIFGSVSGVNFFGVPIEQIRFDGIGFGFYFDGSWIGR